MLFHTWEFLVYFIIVYVVHLLIGNNKYWVVWLMVTSYVFYGWWNPWFLILIIGCTLANYFAVILMEKTGKRKLWLTFGMLASLAPLAYYKYTGFFAENRHFINCLKEGKQPMTNFADSVRTMELVDRIYHSQI